MILDYLEAGNIRLAYAVSGPPDGPACILIHGWTGSIAEWSTVVGPLNALGWRTLALDCPGHGHSAAARARELYTMPALADLHYAVARVLGFPLAVVVGFSMGGAIAEEYALRHAEAVRGVVLLGSAGGDWVDDEAAADIAEALPIAFSAGMEALWEVRAQRLYPEELKRLTAEERARRRQRFAQTSPEGYTYTLYGLLAKRNTVAEMGRLGKPTLILHGEREQASIIEAAQRLHAALPASTYVVVPNAGHFAQQENPEVFNSALMHFLQRL
jgi:pimeloyl-ACP methyl ester carboxylesterase